MIRVYLTSDYATDKAVARVREASKSGLIMEIREPTRTDEQNRKLHPMIRDIIRQVPGATKWSLDQWKLRFMNALSNETVFLEELEGPGMFPVGQKTSELNKAQFSALVELVYAFGAKHGVKWSDPMELAA